MRTKDNKSDARSIFGYCAPMAAPAFQLPPGCMLVLLTPKQIRRMSCGEGEGAKVLCSPKGLPVAKQHNVRDNELCLVLSETEA